MLDEVAQWLANAPLEALAPPGDPGILMWSYGFWQAFSTFRPMARQQLGERLTAAWPDAARELDRAGFVSCKTEAQMREQ